MEYFARKSFSSSFAFNILRGYGGRGGHFGLRGSRAPSRSTPPEHHSAHTATCSLGNTRLRPLRFGIVLMDARTLPPLDARQGSAHDLARQQSRGASLRMGFGMGGPLAYSGEFPSAAGPERQSCDAGLLVGGQRPHRRQQRPVLRLQSPIGFPAGKAQGRTLPHRQRRSQEAAERRTGYLPALHLAGGVAVSREQWHERALVSGARAARGDRHSAVERRRRKSERAVPHFQFAGHRSEE